MGWFVGLSQRVLIHFVIPVWYCSHGNRSKTALRACSSAGLEEVSSLRLVFLLSLDDPGKWDNAAVEPSTCSGEGQDLAEPDTFDAEAAYVSTLHKRAVGVLKLCSISVSLVAKSPSVFVICESMRDIQFVRAGICAICVSKCTHFERRASSFSSVVLPEQVPIPSRSEPEPLGEPKFEEEACEVSAHLFRR